MRVQGRSRHSIVYVSAAALIAAMLLGTDRPASATTIGDPCPSPFLVYQLPKPDSSPYASAAARGGDAGHAEPAEAGVTRKAVTAHEAAAWPARPAASDPPV